MKRAFLSFMLGILIPALVCGEDFSNAGPYAPGWIEIDITRPNSSSFKALFYYPAETAGENTALDPNAAPYPGISFGHGFLTNPDKYRSTYEHLSSWGYYVIASRSGGQLFPNHQNFANDLRYCLDWLTAENNTPSSFLYQNVNEAALGLSGHSMGGGCSILAAADDSRIKAVANLAAAETNPSAIDAMAFLTAPVSLICGSDDAIVPVSSHGQLMYDNGKAPKQLPIIIGGYHCGFLDSDMIFCDNGSISRSEQLTITRHLLTAFFELYLKNNQNAWSHVWGPSMLEEPRWTVDLDAGFSLTPAMIEQTYYPGIETNVTLTLTNLSENSDQYEFFAEGNQWPVLTSVTESPVLEPGQSNDIDVVVSFPAEYSEQGDTAIVSARSKNDGATRTFSRINSFTAITGDFDGDQCVSFKDLKVFTFNWLSSPCREPNWCGECDFNYSGRVTFEDFVLLAKYWLQCF